MKITPELKKQFDREGYLIFENTLSPDRLKNLRQACQNAMDRMDAEMDRLGVDVNGINHRGKRYFAPFESERDPLLRDFIESDSMLEMVQGLIGPNVYHRLDQFVVKCAEVGMAFAWHQDSGYPGFPHTAYLTCWIPLDPATIENGTIYVLPLERTGGPRLVEHKVDPETNDKVGYTGDDPGIPVEVPAGSVVVFSSLTFHRSGVNTTDKMRRVLVQQYGPEPLINPETGEIHLRGIPLVLNGVRQENAISNYLQQQQKDALKA